MAEDQEGWRKLGGESFGIAMFRHVWWFVGTFGGAASLLNGFALSDILHWHGWAWVAALLLALLVTAGRAWHEMRAALRNAIAVRDTAELALKLWNYKETWAVQVTNEKRTDTFEATWENVIGLRENLHWARLRPDRPQSDSATVDTGHCRSRRR